VGTASLAMGGVGLMTTVLFGPGILLLHKIKKKLISKS